MEGGGGSLLVWGEGGGEFIGLGGGGGGGGEGKLPLHPHPLAGLIPVDSPGWNYF